MSKVPGKPWADVWKEISFPAKKHLVRQIASFCSDTFAHRFYGIGNLLPNPRLPEPEISRGPFATSREWLSVRLDLAESNCRRRLSRVLKSDEELECVLETIARLRVQLPNFFPSGGPEIEPSVIYHNDMNRHNIMVDDAGALTAVVDWDCVSALPLYMACQYPPFLQGKRREVKPIKSEYQYGNAMDFYWEHLGDYELTQLRRMFLLEMENLQPDWVSTFKASQRQRDYDLAGTACADPFMRRRIAKWLSDLESGAEGVPGLE
ncbi:hypothetical protein LX32DRAFT_722454 [Colletotrichum zoysiae]|uniref:Aminoglycoside phosphotransferase domain-containing protein n=1 Tax=Colletotrichum zoysiae TaxID=1216348 RepID=A0AAD9HRZ0_9PEZI|nr:hypothetical protein LX32DRAFT_722454 [Colletotrichum zoysiae]